MRKLLAFATVALAGAALAVLPASPASAVDQCAALGGSIAGGECVLSTHVTRSGPFTLDETLHITSSGSITVSPVTAGLTLTINGGFIMDANSKIDGSTNAVGSGATIKISTSADITLATGAKILSNQNLGSCTGASKGGDITLEAQGNVTTATTSEIKSISPCGKGTIKITGTTLLLQGIVLSEGTTTRGRGGPVTAIASCNLTVSPTGQLISRGKDPGADLVHVEGGCVVNIFGLVTSTGAGHIPNEPNLCKAPNRPDKPANSSACVEIWAGDTLVINSKAPNNGEVHADTGMSGGTEGIGWVSIYARGDITIVGDTAAPYSVHVNQTLSNGHGGLLEVKSTEGMVTMSGLALQASDATTGGQGGKITVQAKADVDMSGGKIEAKGSTAGGGGQQGGQVSVRSFGTAPSSGSIVTTATSIIDVTGRTPANGIVTLSACGTIGFPPGSVVPAGVVPTKATGVCGGNPEVPTYVKLPVCVCACVCATGFRPTTAPLGPTLPLLTINGTGLKQVTGVVFSLNCEPTEPGALPGVVQLPKSDTSLKIEVPAGLLTGTPYRVILLGPTGSCCSADFFQVGP